MFWKNYIYLNLAASVFLHVKGYAISNETNHGECLLPSYPQNGKWVIIGGTEARPGSTVPTNSTISFSCNEPYKISSDYSKIICLGKNWNLPPPECLIIEKIQKAKRGVTVTRNGYGEVIIENNGRPNTNTRQIITLGGNIGNGIVVQSDGNRLVVNSGQGITLGGNGKDGISIANGGEIDEGRVGGILINKNGVQVGGTKGGGIVIETGGQEDEGRSNSYTRQTITLGRKVGDGIAVKSDGNILAVSSGQGLSGENEQDGILIENEGEIVGGIGGGIRINRKGVQIGGTGGDGIIIGNKGRRVVVGTADKGRPNSYTRQTLNLGKNTEDGIVVQSDGNRLVISSGQGIILGENGQDVISIGNGGEIVGGKRGSEIQIDRNGVQIDRNGVQIDGTGGDDIIIGTGGRRVVVGTGDEGNVNLDTSGVSAVEKGETEFVNGETKNTRQRGDDHTVYEEGRRGRDGLVIEEGEAVNGYAIGVGQPGGNGQQKGGRGGDGAVVNAGDVNGVLVGIGGQGGNAGSTSSNDQQRRQDEKAEATITNQNGKQRKKRQTVTTYKSESSSYSKSESSSYSKVSWTTFTVGGGGGHGVVIYGGTINGNVYGVGGAGGK